MLKDFFKKIQNLEEDERRQILMILTIITTVFVFLFWISELKSIFENQAALNQKKPTGATLPSIKENLKSTVGELRQIISEFNSRLKSQVFPEPQVVTRAPSPTSKPIESLPPAVKLPD